MSEKLSDGNTLTAARVNEVPPVGSIVAWAKTLTGVPALPDNWVECSGQTLSDAESPLNGQVIPNLNTGSYKMLRGASTSGGTGGEDTHQLTTAEIPSHSHSITTLNSGGSTNHIPIVTDGSSATVSANTNNAGGDGAHNNIPAYYSVVWIMKIK